MSIISTFFLRYVAQTKDAQNDIKALNAEADKAEKSEQQRESERRKRSENEKKQADDASKREEQRIRKRTEQSRRNEQAENKATERLTKFGKASQGIKDSLSGMRGGVEDVFNGIRASASVAGEAVTGIGVAGAAAGVAAGAVLAVLTAGIAGANRAIDDALAAAQRAKALGKDAYAAHVSTSEAIRITSRGRGRGLSDEESLDSARGVNAQVLSFLAAQRAAARDPASAFNNPELKKARMWQGRGVNFSDRDGSPRAVEQILADQDKYLRKLKEQGEEYKALTEGVELFGRNIFDVKNVLSQTQKEVDQNAIALAHETEIRRGLQKDSENLAVAQQKLTNEQKKNQELIDSKTTPATIKFKEAMIEWERAIRPLKEAWADFVTTFIKGFTEIVQAATNLIKKFRADSEERKYVESAVSDAAAPLRADLAKKVGLEANDPRLYEVALQKGFYKEVNAIRIASDKARADAANRPQAERVKESQAKVPDMLSRAQDRVLQKTDKGLRFDGRLLKPNELENALKAVREITAKSGTAVTEDDIVALLKSQLDVQTDMGKTAKAQVKYQASIDSTTKAMVNTSLEQAMALWAAGVGQGAGVASGGYKGETQSAYEKRVRSMQQTINPNRLYSSERGNLVPEALSNVNAASKQAQIVNDTKSRSTTHNRSVSINEIKVSVDGAINDALQTGKDLGEALFNQLRNLVMDNSSGVIS